MHEDLFEINGHIRFLSIYEYRFIIDEDNHLWGRELNHINFDYLRFIPRVGKV